MYSVDKVQVIEDLYMLFGGRWSELVVWWGEDHIIGSFALEGFEIALLPGPSWRGSSSGNYMGRWETASDHIECARKVISKYDQEVRRRRL